MIDRYTEGLFDKAECEPRVTGMRERLQHMEVNAQLVRDETSLERELTLILGRLDEFAARVKTGLHEADWLTRREIIRALVKRVEIGQEQVRAVFRVNPPPHTPQPLQKKIPKVCIMVGGVHSPILSTISLSKLDHYIENTLIPMYTKGARQKSREYSALAIGSRHP